MRRLVLEATPSRPVLILKYNAVLVPVRYLNVDDVPLDCIGVPEICPLLQSPNDPKFVVDRHRALAILLADNLQISYTFE